MLSKRLWNTEWEKHLNTEHPENPEHPEHIDKAKV